MPLHSRLAAERAHITGVLRDFHLLDLFAEGGAVSGMLLEEVVATWVSGGGFGPCAVFTGHTDLCGIC